MKLYHCTRSRSSRVLWLLEELGLAYEIEVLPFDADALRSVDYLAIDSFGKVPVLVDGPLTMFASVAIVQYLLDRYGEGRLQPQRSAPEYGQFLEWMHFGESTLMGPVSQVLQHVALLPQSERRADIAEQGLRTFAHYAHRLDEALADQTYLIDHQFTAADIVVGYTLFVADGCQALPGTLERLNAYYRRLTERPACQKAVA